MYANNEDRKKWWKKYKEEHREEIKQRNHLYWQSISGKDNKKRYYKAHQEAIIQKVANYNNQNKDKIKKRQKIYYNNVRNPGIKVWEQHYGKIPKGWIIIHKDKNKNNNKIDNLVLIKKSELGTMNLKNIGISSNKNITETNILIAKLINKIGKIEKRGNK